MALHGAPWHHHHTIPNNGSVAASAVVCAVGSTTRSVHGLAFKPITFATFTNVYQCLPVFTSVNVTFLTYYHTLTVHIVCYYCMVNHYPHVSVCNLLTWLTIGLYLIVKQCHFWHNSTCYIPVLLQSLHYNSSRQRSRSVCLMPTGRVLFRITRLNLKLILLFV